MGAAAFITSPMQRRGTLPPYKPNRVCRKRAPSRATGLLLFIWGLLLLAGQSVWRKVGIGSALVLSAPSLPIYGF